MKKNRILAILLTFVMLASMLSACSKNDSNKNGTNTTSNQQSASEQKNENNTTSNTASSSEKTGVIKIGSIHDLSGNGSVLGNASVQGHKLAIEDINNAGGVKIGDTTYTLELVSYDCKSDPCSETSCRS